MLIKLIAILLLWKKESFIDIIELRGKPYVLKLDRYVTVDEMLKPARKLFGEDFSGLTSKKPNDSI